MSSSKPYLLRALHESLENGSMTLLSAEPPRATWGPVRDSHRDQLISMLS